MENLCRLDSLRLKPHLSLFPDFGLALTPGRAPLAFPLAGSSPERAEAVAVGTWGMEAAIYALPSLKPLFSEKLPTDVIPRRWLRLVV